jgi:hypothetical protein
MTLGPTLLIYVLIGLGVAVAVYVTGNTREPAERWFAMLTAIPFWPVYIPLLLTRAATPGPEPAPSSPPQDEMAAAIRQVDAELQAALDGLDGWAEGVLAREKHRMHELSSAWTAQSERIREMDRLLAKPQDPDPLPLDTSVGITAGGTRLSPTAADRLRHSQQVRRQNLERLRQVRKRAYEDLMGTLAWVRELVSMIHLAKFTGAPASRAEELVAQIAAAVEGLSEVTWQEEADIYADEQA